MYEKLVFRSFIALVLMVINHTAQADGFESERRALSFAETAEILIKPLIGKVVWFYPNNTYCKGVKIRKDSDDSSAFYKASSPVKLLIIDLQSTGNSYYFHVKINDDKYGFLPSSTFESYYRPLSENEMHNLQTYCFFEIDPQQLQARIDESINLKNKAREEKQLKERVELEAKLEEKQKDNEAFEKLVKDAYLVRKEEEARATALLKVNSPEILKQMTKYDFCRAYGQYLRGEVIAEIGSPENIKGVVSKEVIKRKLKLNTSLIKSQKLNLNMSECELYASLGFPRKQNVSTGAWGEHIQHIYVDNEMFVYTENGRVTSWQQ